MLCGASRVTIPNPHGAVIDIDTLASVLNQAGLTRREWEQL